MCDSVVKCERLNRTKGCVTRGGSLSVSAKTAKITSGKQKDHNYALINLV